MSTVALQQEYQYVDSTRLVGHATPTIHIDKSVYNRVEWLLDQFVSARANIDLLRDFSCVIPMRGNRELAIKIDGMYVYWRKCSADDGAWYEPIEIYPTWAEAKLYDEDGELLPHDFDINVVIKRLTFH